MDHILSFWNRQAESFGTSAEASWGDSWMVALEIEEIVSKLGNPSTALDVGCSNGHATLRIAKHLPDTQFRGVDFSPQMIGFAEKAAAAESMPVDFQVADARSLPFADDSFDSAFTTRTLINLPTWTEQRTAVEELIRVTKVGGRVVLSEAFWEPLCAINSLRLLVGLEPLREHDFNRYLKRDVICSFLDSAGLSWSWHGYSSLYYLGSRVMRELCSDPSEHPGYSNPVNQAFFELEKSFSGGPFSVQAAIVIEIG